MKIFFKLLSAMMLILSIGIFSFVSYGTETFESEYRIVKGERLKTNSPVFKFSSGVPKDKNEYDTAVNVFGIFPVKRAKVKVYERKYLAVGGEVFGVKLYTKGVLIVGSDDIETSKGKVNPAIMAGLKKGDIILKINGENVSRNNDISDSVKKSNGNKIDLQIERAGEIKNIELVPQKDKNDNEYKAGLWVRDSSAGIGTVTYYDTDKMIFAGLGHPVCDVDTGKRLEISGGDAVNAEIKGCYKSKKGDAGELCGVFSDGRIGALLDNTDRGIFGKISENPQKKQYPVALNEEVKTGKAQIISTVDSGEPEYYNAEITKIYKNEEVRNLVIKITDRDLIKKTGGIVQGMSGSPIIQDGKLVGAVTHVLVNNPTMGYGIFIENMMNEVA